MNDNTIVVILTAVTIFIPFFIVCWIKVGRETTLWAFATPVVLMGALYLIGSFWFWVLGT